VITVADAKYLRIAKDIQLVGMLSPLEDIAREGRQALEYPMENEQKQNARIKPWKNKSRVAIWHASVNPRGAS
jgi:hypothetical protein